MPARAESDDTPLGMTELTAWVAGLAATAGLVVEVARSSIRDPSSSPIHGLLVLYVVYFSCSIRTFWKVPRIAIPSTLLLGAALWTLALQSLERADFVKGSASAVFIPLAMAYVVRLLAARTSGIGEVGARSANPSLAQSLIDRGKAFGKIDDRAH